MRTKCNKDGKSTIHIHEERDVPNDTQSSRDKTGQSAVAKQSIEKAIKYHSNRLKVQYSTVQ